MRSPREARLVTPGRMEVCMVRTEPESAWYCLMVYLFSLTPLSMNRKKPG
jgi:hypothetical protein